MTQVGDGPSAPLKASVGDLLAARYRLEQHINDDGQGRHVWRGVDVVLRRPVAIVMRHPGGESAEEMLNAAVTASRVTHPNLIGVYDAIDEGERAYVVREWIDGNALRELVAEDGPLDAERTTSVLHAVAEAVAALHASGMAHGNIHPGTVLVGQDGRVVLTDARVDSSTSLQRDIRAMGALGYFMLTNHWPREAGHAPASLPDARRESSGALTAPRQVRAGVPAYLDDLVMDLLNRELAVPSAAVLASELARLDTGEQLIFGGGGTLRFVDDPDAAAPARSATPKLVAVGGTALALVITGMVLGIKALNANADPNGDNNPPAATQSVGPPNPRPITLSANQVRIVDPGGDRAETKNSDRVVDGNPDTIWFTNGYKQSNFGGKPGMGILIKLNEPAKVASVKVELTMAGATAELRTGAGDPGDTTVGDQEIEQSFTIVGKQQPDAGTTVVFPTDLSQPYQYLLIWITSLPTEDQSAQFPYKIGVREITVEVQ